MPTLLADDGTTLAYRLTGDGPLLLCLPGGPGEAAGYFGDLGGLSATRALVLPDLRGTGASTIPADPASYRIDRLVPDVEALRRHLGLEQVDLLGHSAAGGLAMLYAARHPERVRRLVLAAPSQRVLGIGADPGTGVAVAARAGEPWYDEAFAALHAEPTSWEDLLALRYTSAPFLYGPWDDAARAYARLDAELLAQGAYEGFYAGFEPDPALGESLAALECPVLVIGGELDVWPCADAVLSLASRFREGSSVLVSGAGHFPWIEDPAAFSREIEDLLRR